MSTVLDVDLLKEVEQFVYREARYADELRYDAWESLWTDDAVYWVPANGADTDPTRQMSVLFDNRARIGTRIKQLQTGKRHAQAPPSNLRRLVSNVELLDPHPELPQDIAVGANFLVVESRERGTTMWAGRSEYVLRRAGDGELRMARKKVVLIDNERPLNTLAFLI
ncbi:aromatic-ring-hydroxylating dioxygenase subunit beta [Paraconexibacter sp.]|uniref:aromatic-ring-hydroxylating dioxygenase subunit beta n=1 Tax=Paraconexibacter sp. TaxID=2949640 RepID=UPI0035638DF4